MKNLKGETEQNHLDKSVKKLETAQRKILVLYDQFLEAYSLQITSPSVQHHKPLSIKRINIPVIGNKKRKTNLRMKSDVEGPALNPQKDPFERSSSVTRGGNGLICIHWRPIAIPRLPRHRP